MQQALHLLAIEHFGAEVWRVLRPLGLLQTDDVPITAASETTIMRSFNLYGRTSIGTTMTATVRAG